MDANFLALQVLWMIDARFRVVENRAVMEDPRWEDRYRCKRLTVRLGAEIRGERELTNIKFRSAHHAAECLDQNGDILILDFETLWLHAAFFEGVGVSQG